MMGVAALKSAVEKLGAINTPNTLTAVHVDFTLACIKSSSYHAALSVINTPMHTVSPHIVTLEDRDYLSYFYYTGMIYSALKMYAQAVDAFALTLAIPSHAISAIQIMSYKKYILTSLLLKGDVDALPARSTSQIVLRNIDALTTQYGEAAKAYKQGSEPLKTVIALHYDVFKQVIQLLHTATPHHDTAHASAAALDVYIHRFLCACMICRTSRWVC